MEISYQYDSLKNIQSHWYFTQAKIYFSQRYFTYNIYVTKFTTFELWPSVNYVGTSARHFCALEKCYTSCDK